MKEFKVIKFLDRFKYFFEKIGVDYDVMRKILQLKFTIDSRRTLTVIGNSSKKKIEDKDENKFIKSLWVYVLMGIVMVPLAAFGKNFIYQMSFVFGILMFMIMTSLISDFSSVLLDIRDKNIIFSKPVSNKTLSMAKIIHILVYMFFITASLCGLALIVSLIKRGILFFLIFLLEIVLMNLFIVVLTALLYLLILKFFDGEKLKDIINYVQIALSLGIAVGYQLIGRLFNFVDLNMVFSAKWWQYFIVPIWFAAPFELVLHHNYNFYFIIFSILAVIVPVISIVIYIKLIPNFERNLQKLNNSNGKLKKKGEKFFYKISNIICRNKLEKVFFKFTLNMMKNEREFKLKVYPSLGFSLIFPFIFIFNELHESGWHSIASSKMYLNIYFCALFLPTIVMMMKYSETYKAAWIYKIIPNKDVSYIFRGALKACIIKLICPVYFFECIIFICIFGVRIFPDLILIFLNMMFFITLCFKFLKKALPFSEGYGVSQGSEGLMVFPLMMIFGVLAAIHYASSLMNFGIYMYIIIMLIVDIITWEKSFNLYSL